jgi:serine/threonine-protein kinase HipA
MTTVAEVRLWGSTIGAVAIEEGAGTADFEFAPEFIRSRIQVAPLTMPLSAQVYRFPDLPYESFHGLPGLLADSLPDKFGNILIEAWLATQGRRADSLNAVERLCYTGSRGMGALEFAPIIGPKSKQSTHVEVGRLVNLASEVLTSRNDIGGSFNDPGKAEVLRDILRVGTSAGGARAKAIIAWNPDTNEVRSGQVQARDGFDHWILKFDGVSGNRDRELDDPQGYGCIEYAYSKMARDCGISMNECRLLEENGRQHFMTRRFDRLDGDGKLHMQTLGAMAHFDFNAVGAYGYEQALLVIRQLDLGMDAVEEQFRRMVFNIVARNQDDHVKNIAFLMNRQGEWSLSPAFDVTYAYNPTGTFTSSHQMTLNLKRGDFVLEDFKACARTASMKRGRAAAIVDEVQSVVSRWPEYADAAGVAPNHRDMIQNVLRVTPFD